MHALLPVGPVMSRSLRATALAVVVALAGAAGIAAAETAAGPAPADVPNVAGPWTLTVETSAGTGTPTVVFAQDGATLSGTYRGRFGSHPLTGTLDGAAISFSFTVSGPMGTAEVAYSGTVAGDEMSGTLTMGERPGGRFRGRRQ
jgi:hypothetical protein